MNFDDWLRINRALEHPPRDSENNILSTWPQIDFTGKIDPDKAPSEWTEAERVWAKLRDTYEAAEGIAAKAKAHAEKVAQDGHLSDEGKQYVLDRYRKVEVLPKIDALRELILEDARKVSQQRLDSEIWNLKQGSGNEYLDKLDEAALAGMREAARGGKKFTPAEIAAMRPETRRAIALADPIASGLSPNVHGLVEKEYFEEFGGGSLADARAQLEAVAKVGEAVDTAQVIADREAGFTPMSEQAQAAAKAREAAGVAKAEAELPIQVIEGEAN